ncbi:DMT family transporter [Streptomyces sp. NBC_00335]|uniref:DMT family transporter n=1 Tax=unclassified Streptomyces TaxID=2593676 RepID=UPI00224DE4AE|nr:MULTISPECIES: DMT family transporter [unclassified Streptomyces]MCX5408731.1 DMT family transporter [Streptomyces sp. NBC_00086]
MGFLVPVLFALFAALSNALATVLQRRAALIVPQSDGFRFGLVLDLLRQPLWIGGILAVIAAGAGQAVALATGALALVQPLFVLELPLALLIASLVTRTRMPGPLWLAVGAVVAGLGIVLVAASPTGNRTDVPVGRWAVALAACAVAVAALSVAGLRRPPGRIRAGCLGAATAVCYALTAALMKSAMHVLDEGGIGAFLRTWETYGFAATGICALLLLEHAMQGGPLVASQPALTLGDAGVSVALGVLLYEEHLRTHWWLLPQVLGLSLICAGVLALARHSAGAEAGTT